MRYEVLTVIRLTYPGAIVYLSQGSFPPPLHLQRGQSISTWNYASPFNAPAASSSTIMNGAANLSAAEQQVAPYPALPPLDHPYWSYFWSQPNDSLTPVLAVNTWTDLKNGAWVGLAADQCYIQHLSSYYFRDWWEVDKRGESVPPRPAERDFNFFLPWHWEPSHLPRWWSAEPQSQWSVQDRQGIM